jgi:hypothetical protein
MALMASMDLMVPATGMVLISNRVAIKVRQIFSYIKRICLYHSNNSNNSNFVT